MRRPLILALLALLTVAGCAVPAPAPTATPHMSRVLTPAEQEAWLAREAKGRVLCEPLRPIQMPSGLTCWDGITLPAD